jgi:hypothetical protein
MQLYFCIGEYHKYDNIAYPKSKKISKSVKEYTKDIVQVPGPTKSVKDYAKGIVSFMSGGLFFGKSKEIPESFTPLSHQEMSEFCLEYYLTKIKEMLCSGSLPDGYDINSIALEISFIYESLCVECVSLTTNPITRVWSDERRINASTFNVVNRCVYCM